MNRENGQVHSDDNNQDLNGLDPVEAADPETLPANSSVAGFSGQLSKGLRDPMEGIGKQLASSLTMSGIVNYKSPLLDMKVPSALTGFSEQLSKGLRDPMEGIGKQLASSLTMSGIVNYKSPLLDMNVTGKFSGLSRSWLDEFEKDGTEGFVASLREDLAVDPALALEIDEIFERLGAPEDLLDETAEFLNLTMPFGHDSAVRTGLQIVAVTSLFAILLMIFLSNPFLGAVLSAVGTPNVAVSWKATGKAYDRLYGLEAKPKPGAKSSKGGKPGLLANGRGRKRSGRW